MDLLFFVVFVSWHLFYSLLFLTLVYLSFLVVVVVVVAVAVGLDATFCLIHCLLSCNVRFVYFL